MPTPGTRMINGIGTPDGRGVRCRVALVVGLVVGAVRLVELAEPGDAVLDRGVRVKIKY